MLLIRKTENQSTGLHIWVSPFAQLGDMLFNLMISMLGSISFIFVKVYTFLLTEFEGYRPNFPPSIYGPIAKHTIH